MGEGSWKVLIYETSVERREILALVKGDPGPQPTLVRVHTGTVLGDIFMMPRPQQTTVRESLNIIEEAGEGVIVFFPHQGRISREFKSPKDASRKSASNPDVLREFGVGAQVLKDIGLKQIRLITRRPQRIVGLDGYGLEIVEQLCPSSNLG